MLDDPHEKLSAVVTRLVQGDSFHHDSRSEDPRWPNELKEHVEVWVGDQAISYVGYEWHFTEGEGGRRSRGGYWLADSLSLVVLTDKYVMQVRVEPSNEPYGEPVIASSRIVPRSGLAGLRVEPRNQDPRFERHGLRLTLEYESLSGPIQIPSASVSHSMVDADSSLLPGLRDDYFAPTEGKSLDIIP